jgi:hypothetical protein
MRVTNMGKGMVILGDPQRTAILPGQTVEVSGKLSEKCARRSAKKRNMQIVVVETKTPEPEPVKTPEPEPEPVKEEKKRPKLNLKD